LFAARNRTGDTNELGPHFIAGEPNHRIAVATKINEREKGSELTIDTSLAGTLLASVTFFGFALRSRSVLKLVRCPHFDSCAPAHFDLSVCPSMSLASPAAPFSLLSSSLSLITRTAWCSRQLP
jgi:hypothetical protein